jgi:hypothetical protein
LQEISSKEEIMMRLLPVLAPVFLAIGCGSKDEMPEWPPFAMTIPDDVPEEMTVVEPNWTEHRVNGKEYYATGYRSGWKQCVHDYTQDALDFSKEKPDMIPIQHYGVVVRGYDAGYLRCWTLIRETTRKSDNKKPMIEPYDTPQAIRN